MAFWENFHPSPNWMEVKMGSIMGLYGPHQWMCFGFQSSTKLHLSFGLAFQAVSFSLASREKSASSWLSITFFSQFEDFDVFSSYISSALPAEFSFDRYAYIHLYLPLFWYLRIYIHANIWIGLSHFK